MTEDKFVQIESTNEKVGRLIATSTLASLTSLLPVIGPVMQTLISETLPDKRFERLEDGLNKLEASLGELAGKIDFTTDSNIEIMEDGLHQFARSISSERRKYIAGLVARGLINQGFDQQETRHFMRLLEQLDDRQIVLLAKFHPKNLPASGTEDAQSFYENNRDVLEPGHSIKDLFDVEGREHSERAVRLNSIMIGQLASIGLLEEVESIDNVGKSLQNKQFYLSEAGKDFLAYIGGV